MRLTGKKVYCVTGIDTDIGKTIATGMLARALKKNGVRVITQKIVQTGCTGLSEDIIRHRELMGMELQQVDLSGLTCPYVFEVPCSPHLAAQLSERPIDCDVISEATSTLLEQYDLVLLEGAGGLLVPLNDEITLLDYLVEQNYSIILVSSPRLGSINHTLSALELTRINKIDIAAILYNRFERSDPRIEEDSRKVFSSYLNKTWPHAHLIDLYPLDVYRGQELDDALTQCFDIK